MKAAIPHLKAAGGGAIVSVSSNAAFEGNDWIPAYGASKVALHALIRHVARIAGRDWIRCNGIAPGMVETVAAMGNVTEDLRAAILASQALPRLGAPDDIASAMAFLLSDEARWITGQVIAINGGSAFRD
jgi:NAD(P)-dependent dehydrogenase (short-subunit alcohol dehydrogenase family)